MRKTLGIIAIIIWLVSTTQCAKRGTPTGGAKDSIPPRLVSANPPLNTVNFDAEKIVMVFDEYIKLNDIANQLIVSPPMERSDYRILPEGTVSKKVEIRLKILLETKLPLRLILVKLLKIIMKRIHSPFSIIPFLLENI